MSEEYPKKEDNEMKVVGEDDEFEDINEDFEKPKEYEEKQWGEEETEGMSFHGKRSSFDSPYNQ